MQRLLIFTLLIIAVLGRFSTAQAHGGNYIISEARGRYFVVVSLSPAPATVGRADISIAVRNSTDYTPLPVERVTVQLISGNDAPISYDAPAEGNAADAIYGSHVIDFTTSGAWRVLVTINDGTETHEFAADVQVAGGALRWLNVAAYMLPLAALFGLIGLAALRNRKLRRVTLTENLASE